MARFEIHYDRTAVDDLRALRRVDQVAILGAIERHLRDEPSRVSRQAIKKLEPPVLAGYRLRVGDYRVFYDVYEDRQIVLVVAVRFKGRMTLDEAAHDSSD
ncbi:MAG TPA: type II toxin-antitoxin system RelE/ParE family toxin [Phycisphaerae bacterium]|nr:type II toxin-antitoxin system RelE/ParE family toxin [Phycisphaerae bacterium]HRR85875.1 type II toxin-antitoxin system RelE/ParE family toxin [Phycisphaerae bacterium]